MSYDVFLSHSHVDKDWTRELHDRVAAADYGGRNLRSWLDQEVLDPGDLSSERELESALDRCRYVVLVLTPESVASHWVTHEIEYFVARRGVDSVIVIRRRPCPLPPRLEGARIIDWPETDDPGTEPLAALLASVRPDAGDGFAEHQRRVEVRRAWQSAYHAQPPGLDATPTAQNTHLLELLVTPDIGALDEEGPALVGFDRAGQLLAELDAADGYGSKMVLAEILALAVLRDVAYGRIAARWVQQDVDAHARPSFLTMRNRALRGASGPASSTNRLLAVTRAASKLVEIDATRIDLSTLAAVLHALDDRGALGGPEEAVAMMVARTLGKVRGRPLTDLLIHALVRWGGRASKIAAAGAICTRYDGEDALLYFTRELAERAAALTERPNVPAPSPSTARLLLDASSELRTSPDVEEQVLRARDDLVMAFGADWPDGTALFPGLAYAPRPTHLESGPIVGTVRRVTLADMESLADTLGPTDIACLTEPRIVDALLDGASAYFIASDEIDQPLGLRLRNRGSRFAAFDPAGLARLADGDVVALWPTGGDGAGWGFRAATTD